MSDAVTTAARPRGLVEEFREEFAEVWQRLPNKGLFFGLLAAWLGLFHFFGNSTLGYAPTSSLMGWLYEVFNNPGNPDGEYANIVPFVVLVLFWLKRKDLVAARLMAWWPALIMIGLALMLHVAGYLLQQPKISVVAWLGGIWGLMGLAWGPQFLRRSIFPYCFVVFLMPGLLSDNITFPLRMVVSTISVFLTGTVLGLDVVRDGALIFNSQHTFQFDVAPACSGIRSLVALLALTTVCAMVMFQKPWKRVFVAVLAVPLAILGNVLRITIVILVASLGDPEVAVKIEQNLGFLTFAVALVCLFAVVKYMGDEGKPLAPSPRQQEVTA